jgi:hypothetical protein
LFEWLSSNPIATIFLLITFGLAVVIYVLAFLEGREITFWPPKVSSKPRNFGGTKRPRDPGPPCERNKFDDCRVNFADETRHSQKTYN